MEPKRGECIFCSDGTSFKKKEHVFPEWLLKDLDVRSEQREYKEIVSKVADDGTLDFDLVVRQKKDFGNFVSPFVCDECNGGWMSNLEASVKPILLPLVLGRKTLTKLTKVERLIIARWAIKTTCVIDSVNPSAKENRMPIAADGSRIREMSGTFLPRGWAVFGKLHQPTMQLGYHCETKWYCHGRMNKDVEKKLARFRRTSLVIGNLILVTTFVRHPNILVRAVGFEHFPLALNLPIQWLPKTAARVWIASDDMPNDSSENVANRFAGALSLLVS